MASPNRFGQGRPHRSPSWRAGAGLALLLGLAASGPVASDAPSSGVPAALADKQAPKPTGGFGRQLRMLEEPVPAPEYIFREAGGREWGFVEFRDRVVVATFWATWCGVCRTELPKLDRLQKKLGGEGVTVVALVQDVSAERVEGVLRKRGLSELRAFEDVDDVLSATLGIYGIPTSFVIGPQGNLLASVVGAADWDSPDAEKFFRALLARGSAPKTIPLEAPGQAPALPTAP